MKKIIFLFLLILLSCNKNDSNVIRQKQIISIIQTLLNEKETELTNDIPNEEALPICLNLKKIIVDNTCFVKNKSDTKVGVFALSETTFTSKGSTCIEKIYKSKPIEDIFFRKEDSLDILKQNDFFNEFKIPKSIIKTSKTVEKTKNVKVVKKYLQFSIPIFSSDNTKAYLEYDHHSNGENSYGNSVYLEKINGKWKIKYIERNWSI